MTALRRYARRLPALLALAAVIATSGCAEERPAVDRVQPFALKKSFFVGEDLLDTRDDPEFWTQATLIDVGYGAAQDGLFTSTYAQPMARLRWQITEDLLIGRLAYERIAGTDGKGTGGPTEDGVIVAAFPIEKHFDVTYDYNPTTGEQLNVLEENATDRPWYEREYIRVDFSRSLNVDSYDFDTLSLLGIFGGVTYEPLAYYVDDPNAEDAPFFDFERGYFDITLKAFATPQTIDLSSLGWGIDRFPACFLDADLLNGSFPSGSCSPVELTVRHAFRRVEDKDYEPVDWDGIRFQAYGGFTVERYGYARNYGMSDDRWHRFLTRYPIWERSHWYADPGAMTGPVECYTPATTPFGEDPNRDEDGDGTADECAVVGNGSRCDSFRQRCTLPYQERTPVVTAWYYAEGSNPEFFEPTEQATHEWDVALRVAVRSAQYAECQRVGGEDCAERFPVYFGQQDDNRDAVALAREVDDCRAGRAYLDRNRDPEACRAVADEVGAARGYRPGVIATARMDELLVLCHSPVEAGDHAACGGPRLPEGVTAAQCAGAWDAGDDALRATCRDALRVRRGDLRYHQVNVISEPQTPSPWGIYTDAEDPLTGMTVSASINVWSHVNDLWSQLVVDIARYVAGELPTDALTEGENVRAWSLAAAAAARGAVGPRWSREELRRRVEEMSRDAARAAAGSAAAGDPDASVPATPQSLALPADVIAQVRELRRELTGVAARADAASALAPTYAARAKAAAGTQVEAALMTPAVQELFGVAGLPLTDGLLDLVSPLRGGNPALQRQLRNLREVALGERGACILHEAPAPMSVTGLTAVLQEKFGPFDPAASPADQQARAERMRRYVARRAHYAVVAHEMGHSVGLRHNFVSSSDAWSYAPQYWQLRTRDGSVEAPCTDLQDDGAGCVGPRWLDPVTDAEADNLIWMFMHSSVMDYAGELTQDMMGLGAYDFAATRMFYGDTVAVHADDTYRAGSARALGVFDKVDNFGGILGFQYVIGNDDIHYGQLDLWYDLIEDCAEVDPASFRPASWDPSRDGTWHPLLDGLIVEVDGRPTRCRQQPVDYVPWTALRYPTSSERGGFYRGGPSVDGLGRTRVPYGFATDSWADLGNASVYRHDNGGDTYEIYSFLIAQQEVGHIFDSYRRGRQTFSIRSASGRTLSRYNEKLRDGAKGLTLMRNIYAGFSAENGYDADRFWEAIAPFFFEPQILASSMVFDHFTRAASRPEAGPHFDDAASPDPLLRSSLDTIADPGPTAVLVPNGATGYYGDVGFGGKPVENALADDKGEYDRDYTLNAGSYYDKMYTAMLFTESVDNFISSSRTDFVDARYRATSLADLFPDGYRRFLANALTGDDFLKGPRVATNAAGVPLTDANGFPARPIGWTSWWGDAPRACFPGEGTTVCDTYGQADNSPFGADAPPYTAALDPQIGWEQQKFLIAWTMLYLPENQKQRWIDTLRLWELGADADPGFANRIELHVPSGKVYVAKTAGRETLFGREVQRGVAARVLEYANELLAEAYEVDPVDGDGDGQADWYLPRLSPTTGQPLVRYDPSITSVTDDGFFAPNGIPGCNAQDNSACTCSANRACLTLQDYVSVPAFLRETMATYRLGDPAPKGIY